MSEPLSRDALGRYVRNEIAPGFADARALALTALHYLDRVAELEKDNEALQERSRSDVRARTLALERADRAKAGLAAAQEALNCEHNRRGDEDPEIWGYAEHEGKTWNHCKVCGLLELWEGGTFFGVSLALARGGGQQETG